MLFIDFQSLLVSLIDIIVMSKEITFRNLCQSKGSSDFSFKKSGLNEQSM